MSGNSYSFGNVAGSVQTGDGIQVNVGRDQRGAPVSQAGVPADRQNISAGPVEHGEANPAVLGIRIERHRDGHVAIADSSYGGTYRSRFVAPVDDEWLRRFEGSLGSAAGRDVGAVEGVAAAKRSPEAMAATLGAALFSALFAGQLLTGLRQTQVRADVDGVPLRVELQLDGAPELDGLPWEVLRDPELGRVLALSNRTSVIRRLDVAEPVRRVAGHGALRVLVVAASPYDLTPVAVEREWTGLNRRLRPALTAGEIELARVDPPTIDGLAVAMLHGPWHVFHFIGHGGWTGDGDAGLVLTDDRGRGHPVSAPTLGRTLGDDLGLRVAVLNACHSAVGTDRRMLGGAANGLLRLGIPAVVAMQFAISDQGAICFADRLYAAIAAGLAIDRAVGEGRKALADRGPEWVTPCVYLRGDGAVVGAPTH